MILIRFGLKSWLVARATESGLLISLHKNWLYKLQQLHYLSIAFSSNKFVAICKQIALCIAGMCRFSHFN